jgi:cytoskeletal protein CcmA (bactofilin family)
MSLNTNSLIEANVLNETNLNEINGSVVGDIVIKMYNNNNNNNLFFQSGTSSNRDTGLCISSSNNVGFGTTDVKEKIDVSGGIMTDNYKLPSVTIPIIDISSNIKTSGYMNISKGLSINNNKFSVDVSGNTKMLGNIDVSSNLNLNNVFGISSNGNFTTTGKLDISGSLNINNNFTVSNTGDALIKGLLDVTNKTTFNSDVSLNNGILDVGSNHVLYIDNLNNRVGIGVIPDATYNFYVKGNTKIKGDLVINGTTSIQDTSSNTVTSFDLINNGTGPAIVVNQQGVQPVATFTDDNKPVLYIANNGLTGVGKVDPSYNLDILGTALVKQNLNVNNGLSLNVITYVTSNVNAYITYDFSNNPVTETVLINKGVFNYADASNNIIYWYKFNGSATDMLIDSFSSANNLIPTNNPIFNSTNFKTGNGCLELTGTNYLKLPSMVMTNNTDLAISFWFKSNSTGTILSLNNLLRIRFYTTYLSFTGTGNTVNINIDNTIWNHVVWMMPKSTNGYGDWTIYINGVLNKIFGGYYTIFSFENNYIGCINESYNSYTERFTGLIDDLKIHSKALSASEVALLYSNGNGGNISINTTPIIYNNGHTYDSSNNYIYASNSSFGCSNISTYIKNTIYSLESTNNMVVWYKFDNNNLTLDSSPNNNNLTIDDYPTAVCNSIDFIKGNGSLEFTQAFSNWYLFPFTSKYISLPPYNFGATYGLTIAFWFKANPNAGPYMTILDFNNMSSNNNNIRIQIISQSLIQLSVLDGSIEYNAYIDKIVTLDTWYHFAWVMTKSDNAWNMYVNGLPVFDRDGYKTYKFPKDILLSNNYISKPPAGSWSGKTGFYGKLDDFRIYNKALNINEVQELYGYKKILTLAPGNKSLNSYYWSNNSGFYQNLILNKEVIDKILTSKKLSLSVWKRHENLVSEYPLIHFQKDSLSPYLSILSTVKNNTTSSKMIVYMGSTIDTTSVKPYPPAALCGSNIGDRTREATLTNKLYGNGTYKIAWNGPQNDGWGANHFFDRNSNNNSTDRVGSGGNFGYFDRNGTILTGSYLVDYFCAWVSLELPSAIYFSYLEIIYGGQTNFMPKDYRIYATNDDINYTLLINLTDISYPNVAYVQYDVHRSPKIISSTAYKKFYFSSNRTGGTGNKEMAWFFELIFYGSETPLTMPTSYETTWDNINVSNTWQHLVYTMDYTAPTLTMNLYVDGVKHNNSGTFNIPNFNFLATTTSSYGMIGYNNTDTAISNTYLEDFRMFDRILNNTEIANLYNPSLTATVLYDINLNNHSIVNNNLDISQGIVVNDKLKVDASGNLDTSGNVNVAGTVTIYGNVSQSGTFNQDGDIDVSGNTLIKNNLDISQNLRVNADKFMVDPSSGNILSKGTMDISGYFNVNNKFKIDSTGNITSSGALDISKNFSINQSNLVIDLSGNVKSKGQIDVSNNFIVNTNKFKVDSSGNVQIPGTLDISNNLTLNTNKFTVNSATGAIQSAGNVDISKNFIINTNKFIVDLSGNITSAGTLDISSNLAINTNKFIADASGNIICAGNFDISDNFSLNTNSILIDKSGNILAKGSLTGVQNFSINNNNFYIDTSGNARARGNFDLSQNLTVGGDVFKTNIYNKYVGLNTYNSNNKNILDISGNIGTSTGFFGDISNSIIMSHRDYANNTQYLVKQSYSGEITINNKSSTETIDICFDNTPQCTINSDGDMTLQGTIYTFSDIRIKENVQVIENALEKVKALQGIKYNLIHEDDTTHKKHIGLLAQDVEKVIPEAIETDGDIKTVAYNNLIGLLIQAIKELYCKYKTIKQ